MVSVHKPNGVSFRLFIFVLVIKPTEYTAHSTPSRTYPHPHILFRCDCCIVVSMYIKFVFLVLYFGRYNMITRSKLTICLGLQCFHRITCYHHNYIPIDSSINTYNERTSRAHAPCRPQHTYFSSLGLSFDMTAYYGLTLQSIPLQWHYYTAYLLCKSKHFATTNNQCLRNDNQFGSDLLMRVMRMLKGDGDKVNTMTLE